METSTRLDAKKRKPVVIDLFSANGDDDDVNTLATKPLPDYVPLVTTTTPQGETKPAYEVIDLLSDDELTCSPPPKKRKATLVTPARCCSTEETSPVAAARARSCDAKVHPQEARRVVVVLLVDSREPIEYLNLLNKAGVKTERRCLATFDFLWIAKLEGSEEEGVVVEYVLGSGVERKDIIDLIGSLNTKNKTTGLGRATYQTLKMNQTRVPTKYFLVQGTLQDVDSKHFRYDRTTKMRIWQHQKELERDGYRVQKYSLANGVASVITFLKKEHLRFESQIDKLLPSSLQELYMTLSTFTARADWVTKLGSARKVLPNSTALGPKKMQLILSEFPTEEAFLSAARSGGGADILVQRLCALESDARKRVSKKTATEVCAHLLGGDGSGQSPSSGGVNK